MFNFQIIDLASDSHEYVEAMSGAMNTSGAANTSSATKNDESDDQLINVYIEQMTEQQKKVMEIARVHLQSSFSIVKSIGFKEWVAQQGE